MEKVVKLFKFSSGMQFGKIIGETPKNYIVEMHNGDIVKRRKKFHYKQRNIIDTKNIKSTIKKVILYFKIIIRNARRKWNI
jgi:hypothetical protein